MRQRSPNDKNFVEVVIQALDHLINKEAQGQILAEQLQQTGDVLASVTAEPGKSGIKWGDSHDWKFHYCLLMLKTKGADEQINDST